jgi:lysozyme family protein
MKRILAIVFLLITLQLKSADYCRVVQFLYSAEGGYFKAEDTYKGIMYNPTWITYFGENQRERFLKMDESDWGYIFSQGYWKQIDGYNINDQKVAESIADWAFNAGISAVAKKVDKILGLPKDGKFDKATIDAINRTDSTWLWTEISKERAKFYIGLGDSNPSKYKKFVIGWVNRVINLLTFQATQEADFCSYY